MPEMCNGEKEGEKKGKQSCKTKNKEKAVEKQQVGKDPKRRKKGGIKRNQIRENSRGEGSIKGRRLRLPVQLERQGEATIRGRRDKNSPSSICGFG